MTEQCNDATAFGPDAACVAALLSIDPCGLGGVVLRTGAGPLRDAWLQHVTALLPEGLPFRRMPLHIQDDRLLGGLDLAATLSAGRPVAQRGLLVESDGGIVVAAMAERLTVRAAAHLASVLDTQAVVIERQGLTTRHTCSIGLIALDEGIADDERLPDRLRERLALRLELVPVNAATGPRLHRSTRADIVAARALLPQVSIDHSLQEALCAAALALGVDSLRASVLAVRVARVHAALAGRREADTIDASLAVRLVLLPRATTMPETEVETQTDTNTETDTDTGMGPEAGSAPPPSEQKRDGADQQPESEEGGDGHSVDDTVLEAAAAVLPPGLLALLTSSRSDARQRQGEGRAGVPVGGGLRGRPDGVLRGSARDGARLNLIETLRAAAPWQALRRQSDLPPSAARVAVLVRRDDFRVTRFKQRSETTTVFAVDASGSSALHRLGEAKGAVELLLADCYVRRDSVSLIAFRGRSAEVLLPPTRSLVRARRSLAGLAGGGGTPLATAIDATLALAEATRRRGRTPVAVLLTDGCANVALDGTGGRERAGLDALRSARMMRASGIRTLVLDTSPRPQPTARELAAEMGAVYLPLPHADAAEMSRVVRAAATARPGS